jgi:hypothetical protein
MKHILVSSLLILSFLNVIGCSGISPDRQGKAEKFASLNTPVEQAKPLPDPKINILFVVDNSGSMAGYQAKLAENIEKFADAFFTNTRLDYKIGVVPVYDSKYLNDKTVYGKAGVRKMNPLAELVELKGISSETQKHLYITRNTPNSKEVLKQTVLIGTQWGPEAEESFSPVLAVMNQEHNKNKNDNFYEEDAYLAIIFLTDADDVSPGLSGELFYKKLVELKKGDRSKVLIAAALPNLQNNSKSCEKDGRGPIQSFPSLLEVSGGIVADLCSDNFGETLAKFGNQILQTVGQQKVQLSHTPDMQTLEVRYGIKGTPKEEMELIKPGIDGFMLNPEINEIVISSNWSPQNKLAGAEIFVWYKPVNYKNFNNGRLKELGK